MQSGDPEQTASTSDDIFLVLSITSPIIHDSIVNRRENQERINPTSKSLGPQTVKWAMSFLEPEPRVGTRPVPEFAVPLNSTARLHEAQLPQVDHEVRGREIQRMGRGELDLHLTDLAAPSDNFTHTGSFPQNIGWMKKIKLPSHESTWNLTGGVGIPLSFPLSDSMLSGSMSTGGRVR